MAEDLHTKKASHLSLPIGHDAEYHFNNSELGFKAEPDKNYVMVTPVVCTSFEPGEKTGTTRFKQISKPFIENRSVFNKQSVRKGMAVKMAKR